MEPVRHSSPHKVLVHSDFDKYLADAAKTPWWTAFLDMIYQRRNLKLNELMMGTHDDNQRGEDRLKGAIQELNFILTLGQRGDSLSEENEKVERHGAAPHEQRI